MGPAVPTLVQALPMAQLVSLAASTLQSTAANLGDSISRLHYTCGFRVPWLAQAPSLLATGEWLALVPAHGMRCNPCGECQHLACLPLHQSVCLPDMQRSPRQAPNTNTHAHTYTANKAITKTTTCTTSNTTTTTTTTTTTSTHSQVAQR